MTKNEAEVPVFLGSEGEEKLVGTARVIDEGNLVLTVKGGHLLEKLKGLVHIDQLKALTKGGYFETSERKKD